LTHDSSGATDPPHRLTLMHPLTVWFLAGHTDDGGHRKDPWWLTYVFLPSDALHGDFRANFRCILKTKQDRAVVTIVYNVLL